MVTFDTVVRLEGAKGNRRITVPAHIAKLLHEMGLRLPCWIRMTVNELAPIFVVARRPPSRPSVTATVPAWAYTHVAVGTAVTAGIEDATPYRARGIRSGFDWLPFVDEAYLPVDAGGDLVLWSRHEEPFRLRRAPASPWWLLGLYQTEGSKSDNAPDWTLTNSNPALLAAVPPALETLGIPRERQYIEVLHGRDEAPEDAEAAFACVGVRRATTRPRTGAGHAGVLHVSKSQPLLRLFKAALARIFRDDWQWPSREAARDYALGWPRTKENGPG